MRFLVLSHFHQVTVAMEGTIYHHRRKLEFILFEFRYPIISINHIYYLYLAFNGIDINWKCVEWLQLIWRSGTRLYHLGVPDFLVSCSGLWMQREYHLNSQSYDHQMTCHFLVDRFQVYSFLKYPSLVPNHLHHIQHEAWTEWLTRWVRLQMQFSD